MWRYDLHTPVLIVGASLSGLATAACLRRRKVDFVIIEKEGAVGAPWRHHYDRLHLHTNKRLSGLPYRGWRSSAPRYPSRLEVVEYLEQYQRAFDIRPQFHTEAKSIRRSAAGWTTGTAAGWRTETAAGWITETAAGPIESRYVVMATGLFGRPRAVSFAGDEGYPGRIIHSYDYKTGAEYTGKRVLVVGFGNSAGEIAIDLVEQGAAAVAMAVRSAVNVIPREIVGIPVLELSLLLRYLPPRLADRIAAPLVRAVLGDIGSLGLRQKSYGPIEQIVREGRAPVLDIGVVRLIRSGKVEVFPALERIEGPVVRFADGRNAAFDVIVAGVGFDRHVAEIVDVEERRLEDLRVSVGKQKYFGEDGLYFCGFWVSPTGQIREIGRDAKRIARDIVRRGVNSENDGRMKRIFFNGALAILLWGPVMAQGLGKKHRVVVLTDIEADPDDTQSLIRFLTYCNQWDVEGLIATTSIHQKTRVAPESILRVLDAYGRVQPNLLLHEKGYPTAVMLKDKVSRGLAVYGMAGVGEGHDSPGSELIVQVLKKADDRPVYFVVWGGPNTLAQALWRIGKTMPAADAEAVYRKVRVYTISDQDDSGPWIRKTFPSIFFVVSPGYNYAHATWLGMSFPFPGSDTAVISNEWLARNIQQGHGPLGAAYPDVAYGMEGDTPSFLDLIDNGLNDPEHPDHGGWGGRYAFFLPPFEDSNIGMFKRENWPQDEPETRAIWTNASDSVVSPLDKKMYSGGAATIWRWRREVQNDFAARIEWTAKSYRKCNHPPVPRLAHSDHLTVRSGEQFHLSAAGTTDPDGDSMSYLWFQYPEAGTYQGKVSFRPYAANLYDVPVTAPVVDSTVTIHFILKVTDKGTPPLTRYKRVIVTVLPK